MQSCGSPGRVVAQFLGPVSGSEFRVSFPGQILGSVLGVIFWSPFSGSNFKRSFQEQIYLSCFRRTFLSDFRVSFQRQIFGSVFRVRF